MKGIRVRILTRFKSLQPFQPSIDHDSTYDHIKAPIKPLPKSKEECRTREEDHDYAPDEAEDLFQECNEEDFAMEDSPFVREVNANEVVLYTTSLRGIRKTFEDCQNVKFLLDSFRVIYQERDISMDSEFKEELWEMLGERAIPPRLFIKGRSIGGADEVVSLHELGELKNLLEGIPLVSSGKKCERCNNMRFVVCWNCSGSRKVFDGEGREGSFSRCSSCNENGLIKCLCF